MMYRANEIVGLKVEATDGRIGKVEDIFFDDAEWKVRHFVVDAGIWLAEREVLVTPQAMTGVNLHAGRIQTNLTREKVKSSPPVQTDLPVSRRYEGFLYQHYGWRPYWVYPVGLTMGDVEPPIGAALEKQESNIPETNLRSWRDVTGYKVRATDGFIGHVDELLLSPDDWSIAGIVINAGHWWPHDDVVIDVGAIKAISWGDECFDLAMTKQELRQSVHFRPDLIADPAFDRARMPWHVAKDKHQDVGPGLS